MANRDQIRGRTGATVAPDETQRRLEKEAEEIQRNLTAGLPPAEEPPTPAEQAEEEHRARLTAPQPQREIHQSPRPTMDIEAEEKKALDTLKAIKAIKEKARMPAAGRHSPELSSMLWSAYVDFINHGSEPHTAALLTQAYALSEVGLIIKDIRDALKH